jgi:ABC-2 type transport system permease protein
MMLRLIKIDFKKYFYSKVFWVMTGIYAALLLMVFFGAEKLVNGVLANASTSAPVTMPGFTLYSFPYVWQNLAFFAGFLKIFLALIVLFFITNEFSNKTMRQNIMNGMSRNQFILSKLIFVILLSLASAAILFVSGLILGLSYTEEYTTALALQKAIFIPAYFLEVLTFSIMAMFIAFLVKRSILAIGALALYSYIIEPIISGSIPDSVAKFLPGEAIGNLIDIPNSALMKMFGVSFRENVSTLDAITCLFYCCLFTGLIFLFYQRKDI